MTPQMLLVIVVIGSNYQFIHPGLVTFHTFHTQKHFKTHSFEQGRIHVRTVADGWAGAEMQKNTRDLEM